MEKKRFNIAEIIIYIIVLVLSWVDGTYNNIARSMQGSFSSSTSLSFVDCSIDCLTMDDIIFPIGWIFIALVVILVISNYVDSLSGGSFWYNGDLRRSHLEMGILFYIEVILLLICLAFSVLNNFPDSKVLRYFRAKGLIVNRGSAENGIRLETADELKKLKDLLDEGVITQEEFETKKRQLLKL